MHKPEKSGHWIILARNRLAQRREEKPATKAGQVKALWPEIDAALAGGQSMKSIRKWLEEDAGISLGTNSLTSYISRLRRREKADRIAEALAAQSVQAQKTVETVPVTSSARPAISTSRQTRQEAGDPLAQAMHALSKRAIDIREIHNDGDPNGRKLI
jgi:hypothetical protein